MSIKNPSDSLIPSDSTIVLSRFFKLLTSVVGIHIIDWNFLMNRCIRM